MAAQLDLCYRKYQFTQGLQLTINLINQYDAKSAISYTDKDSYKKHYLLYLI